MNCSNETCLIWERSWDYEKNSGFLGYRWAQSTSADQVQDYEAIMQDYLGRVTYTLLRGADYGKDNRLLPLGFDKTTADRDIAVVGKALSDADFQGGSDTISFRIADLNRRKDMVTAELVSRGQRMPWFRT